MYGPSMLKGALAPFLLARGAGVIEPACPWDYELERYSDCGSKRRCVCADG